MRGQIATDHSYWKDSAFSGESFVATALSPESGNGPLPNSRILKLVG